MRALQGGTRAELWPVDLGQLYQKKGGYYYCVLYVLQVEPNKRAPPADAAARARRANTSVKMAALYFLLTERTAEREVGGDRTAPWVGERASERAYR